MILHHYGYDIYAELTNSRRDSLIVKLLSLTFDTESPDETFPGLAALCIGVGRFRILGGGGKGGANSQQAHDVVMTSMRRNDVASTSFRRHVPTRFLINQCQIITILILKSDIIENSRIELRDSFASTFKSN